jgi:hypothetical protein
MTTFKFLDHVFPTNFTIRRSINSPASTLENVGRWSAWKGRSTHGRLERYARNDMRKNRDVTSKKKRSINSPASTLENVGRWSAWKGRSTHGSLKRYAINDMRKNQYVILFFSRHDERNRSSGRLADRRNHEKIETRQALLFVSKRGRVKSKGDRDLLPSRNIRLSLQED